MAGFEIVHEIAALGHSVDQLRGMRDRCNDANQRMLYDDEIQRQMEKAARFRRDYDRDMQRKHGAHPPCHLCGSRAGARDLSNVFCYTCGGML